ncbi:hypothetical protein QIT80_gp21 (endogenous virus) [Pseudomonas phage phiAH14a]|uniref:Uncharacterized protein n=1 Tax=Pseudomonas phage phiAH14a TaxID=1805958 RepID=A0A1B0VP29_9CAUD|nr:MULTISPECIES: hypothetical protein [unclassified Pseudomonas]YP_010773038.1 hypothetical protein QIT80_gp21 [Pseudomonas phage phiAH14a]AMW64481.1 hypothetical protein AH14a_p21 [Pseudomonas phage phiAH14a]KAA0946690.1 hypothetical protein FQ182_13265 [Pseudomonas sp. ANT_H4]KAA0953209.1 hypothetical protein FQ186_06600 [Pseudomonas sp. ANT_H14]
MKIDLTKKPDGATHINPHSGLWVKCFGGNSGSYQFFKDGEWEMGFGCMSNSYLEIAQPDPWTGEGLPPVGIELEWRYDDHAWKVGMALYIGSVYVILKASDGEQHYYLGDMQFRPIRTPEQIAADERELAITDICVVMDKDPSRPLLREKAGVLYDAGYRKQVAP